MKKAMFFALAALAMLASCNKNNVEKPLTNVYFSEFTVLKAENSFIDKDYVFSNLDKTSSISIVLPNSIHPDSLKSIVFNYKTVPADAIVPVDDTILDGKDTLSFVEPVEIHLQSGEDLWAYNVNISLAESERWAQLAIAPVTDTLYSNVSVAYDAAANKFIAADRFRAKKDDNAYPVYYEFDGKNLSPMKVVEEVRTGSGNVVADVCNGVYYFAYPDYSAATANRITVSKVENGTTSIIGERGQIAKINSSNPVALGVASANSIWYASTANEAFSGTTRRLLNLAKYDGTGWTNAVALEGRPSSTYGYGQYIKKVGNAMYLLVCNQNTFSTSVYKYENNAWSTVYESKVAAVPEGITPSTSTSSYYNNFAVAEDGTVYLCAQVQSAPDVFSLCIQKYNVAEAKLELVSWIPQSNSSKGDLFPSIVLDKNGNPVVAFQGNADNRCFVASINNETKAWEVYPASNLFSEDAPIVAVDKDKNVFVFFISKSNRLVVCAQK